LFLAAGILAGMVLTLARRASFRRMRGRWVSLFLLVVLLGCKSLGAAIFAFLFTGVMTFMTPRWQLRVLMIFAALVVFYPVSRATEVFPHKEITQFIKDTAGPDRAQSLEFRFDNEALLAEHAAKKPWFGWGRYRRNMLFSPDKIEPTSVSDGAWIVIYGVRGTLGFICVFGMLLTPTWVLRKKLKNVSSADDRNLLVGLACMMMMYTVDLIPNGLFTNFPIFFAGAVYGIIKGMTSGGGGGQTVTVTVKHAEPVAAPQEKTVGPKPVGAR
jgi:MFS family permease